MTIFFFIQSFLRTLGAIRGCGSVVLYGFSNYADVRNEPKLYLTQIVVASHCNSPPNCILNNNLLVYIVDCGTNHIWLAFANSSINNSSINQNLTNSVPIRHTIMFILIVIYCSIIYVTPNIRCSIRSRSTSHRHWTDDTIMFMLAILHTQKDVNTRCVWLNYSTYTSSTLHQSSNCRTYYDSSP